MISTYHMLLLPPYKLTKNVCCSVHFIASQLGKNGKKIKDKNAPKRPSTAFIFFSNDERPKVKAANPDIAFGDVAKEISVRWKQVDDKTKVCHILIYYLTISSI